MVSERELEIPVILGESRVNRMRLREDDGAMVLSGESPDERLGQGAQTWDVVTDKDVGSE